MEKSMKNQNLNHKDSISNMSNYKDIFNNQTFFNKEYNENELLPNSVNMNMKCFCQPPLIGLKNIGLTGYMNATLQCLSQIEELTQYFKYNSYVEQVIKRNQNSPCLTKSYKIIIENLWPSNSKYLYNKNTSYQPCDFKETISSMNPLFKGNQMNDPKDLLFLLYLHFMKN